MEDNNVSIYLDAKDQLWLLIPTVKTEQRLQISHDERGIQTIIRVLKARKLGHIGLATKGAPLHSMLSSSSDDVEVKEYDHRGKLKFHSGITLESLGLLKEEEK